MRKIDRSARIAEFYSPQYKKMVAVLSVFFVLGVVLSFSYLGFAWSKYEKMSSDEALTLAQSLATLIHPEHVVPLSGNDEDLQNPDYLAEKQRLELLVQTESKIHFAYIMGESDGSIIFLVDSEPPDSDDYSPPGQIYTEADESTWKPFLSGEASLSGPTTDRWGTWISALVPMKNPETGSVVAVFGIDFAASEWYSLIGNRMIVDIVIVTCLLFLLGTLMNLGMQRLVLRGIIEKLEHDEALYRSVFDQAPIGIAIINDKKFVIDSEYEGLTINPMVEQILGRSKKDLTDFQWTEITHPDDLQIDLEKFHQFKEGEIEGYTLEKRFQKPDGSYIWTNITVSAIDFQIESSVHLCLIEDISAKKTAEEMIKESNQIKTILLTHLPGFTYKCAFDENWTMKYVSSGFRKMTGYSPERVLDNNEVPFVDIITPKYQKPLRRDLNRAIDKGLSFSYEYEIIAADGQRKWVMDMGREVAQSQHGEASYLEGIILDISERKKIEDNLIFLNEHDSLTGLHNRLYLEKLLARHAKRYLGSKRALISMNFSSIHQVASLYGFHYSQDLIKRIAEILSLNKTENCELFKTFESRFVFYIKDYDNKEDLARFTDSVIESLNPKLVEERIEGGIGILEINQESEQDVDHLLKVLLIASEKALSDHKDEFGFSVCWYLSEMEAILLREMEIQSTLERVATDEGQTNLFLQYQPILDLAKDEVVGFEALARLNSDCLGPVSPVEFIPVSEKFHLIVPIGWVILDHALRFLKKLNDYGYGDVSLSINISAIQLISNKFVEHLFSMIETFQVDPNNIVLEITESVFTSNYEDFNRIIKPLRESGIRIAIDDFGTGYSSLSRERELDVDCLKIDKSFIDSLLKVNSENAITGDIVSMAHKLGHLVIAEGVEYVSQKDYLIECNCDKIQGYLVSRPLDEDAAIEFLEGYEDEKEGK